MGCVCFSSNKKAEVCKHCNSNKHLGIPYDSHRDEFVNNNWIERYNRYCSECSLWNAYNKKMKYKKSVCNIDTNYNF
jgi:hypothetical protein